MTPETKIELVFVIDSKFPLATGGRETWLYENIRYLSTKYKVNIIAIEGKGKEFHDLSNLNVNLHTVKDIRPRTLNSMSPNLLANLAFSMMASLYMFRKFFFKSNKIVFISMNPGLIYFPLYLMKRKSHKRICMVRGDWSHEMSLIDKTLLPKSTFNKMMKKMEYLSYIDASLIITNGYDTQKRVELEGHKAVVLPNSINTSEFSKEERKKHTGDKVILSTARLQQIKGIDCIIESIPFIIKCYEGHFKIIFAGSGDFHPYLKKAKDLNVDSYVEFIGEQKDIAGLLNKSDLCLCVSGGSGISISALEAMASGIPIIAWDNITYTQFLTHERTAYLVKPWDSKALGEGIANLLKDDRYINLGINARMDVKKYDSEIMIRKFEEMINSLIIQ